MAHRLHIKLQNKDIADILDYFLIQRLLPDKEKELKIPISWAFYVLRAGPVHEYNGRMLEWTFCGFK